MSISTPQPTPGLRMGVFRNYAHADTAVQDLVTAGFRPDEINVVCSDTGRIKHLSQVETHPPAGHDAPQAAANGSVMGLLIGGLISLGITTTAGLPLLAVGPSLLLGGAVTGGLIGAMETRGREGAAADFYDQALTAGDLLVAVRTTGDGISESEQEARARTADEILRQAGAVPLPVPEEI